MLARSDNATPSLTQDGRKPKQPFDINHQRRRDIARLVKHRHGSLAKAAADLRTKYVIAAAWHCPDDSERRFLMVKWYREAGTPALPSTVQRIDAILEANPPRRMRADTLAKHLHVSDAERTELHIWTIGAYDVPKAERIKRRKEKARLAAQARRRAKGIPPREQSYSRTTPWEHFGIKRRAWELRGKPQPPTTQIRTHEASLPSPSYVFASSSSNGHQHARSPALAAVGPDMRCQRGADAKKGRSSEQAILVMPPPEAFTTMRAIEGWEAATFDRLFSGLGGGQTPRRAGLPSKQSS